MKVEKLHTSVYLCVHTHTGTQSKTKVSDWRRVGPSGLTESVELTVETGTSVSNATRLRADAPWNITLYDITVMVFV
ncbi:unnamed protein product [Pieris brassicae]|uniref:Uncharacterized protein n=1 Tax=Pieris brassicae TaxID=7116 RepID=A0A9P0TN06_PIEBR|nr:unnamed protein product [Pieris brassicae]